jgi:hypothetical protein
MVLREPYFLVQLFTSFCEHIYYDLPQNHMHMGSVQS